MAILNHDAFTFFSKRWKRQFANVATNEHSRNLVFEGAGKWPADIFGGVQNGL